MRLVLAFLLTSAFWAPAVSAAPPRLIFNATELTQLRERCRTDPAARQWKAGLLAEAETILAGTFTLFEQGGGWSHDYACPEDSVGLEPLSPTEHRCPRCGRVYSGGYYDASYIRINNSRNSSNAETLGIAWALSRDLRYAQRAREMLLAYGRKYLSYPIHGVRPGRENRPSSARLYAQTLGESSGHLGFFAAYDCTRDCGLYSPEDRRVIEEDWFREVVKVIARNRAGRSNWQSWHNFALLSAGYLLEDATLVERTLYGQGGVAYQLDASIGEDGLWYEGAISYHFYAIRAVVGAVEVACRNGVNLWDHPRLLAAFTGPLSLAWPNGEYPATNDTARYDDERFWVFDPGYAELYRIAAARSGRVELRWPYSRAKAPTLWAMLYTPPDEPRVETGPRLPSLRLEPSGQVVLRRGDSALLLDYGPHGGGHGHFDKLQALLFAGGKCRAVDPGTVLYGLPIHGQWYRQTLAHNTLTVDGASQRACSGRLVGFASGEHFDWARAQCDDAYPGVRMDRSVLLGEDWMLDVFRVAASEPRVFDLAWHFDMEMECDLPLEPGEISGDSPMYGHLSDMRSTTPSGPWSVEMVDGTFRLRVNGAGAPGAELHAATAPGFKPSPQLSSLIQRREGKATHFAHLLDWGEQPARWNTTEEPGRLRIRLTTGSGQTLAIGVPDAPDQPPSVAPGDF